MNRRQLNQAYYLTKELEMWERKLREAEAKSIASPVITGMPFANTNLNSDPTSDAAITVAKARETVDTLRENIVRLLCEITEYIAILDDPLLRMIINYRCVEFMSWNQVAMKIGGGNTDDSVKKYFYRNIPK